MDRGSIMRRWGGGRSGDVGGGGGGGALGGEWEEYDKWEPRGRGG